MVLKVIVLDREGQRLDNYLFNIYKQTPKPHIYRMVRKGRIKVNGKRCKDHMYHLKKGDELIMPNPSSDPEKQPPNQELCKIISLSVVAENDDFWVLNKPPGLSVHQSNDELHGVVEVMRYLYPDAHLVHRIDRGTSGCLVIAKTYQALVSLQNIWRDKQVEKVYYAVVEGVPTWTQKSIRHPLKRLVKGAALEKVVVSASGQDAKTNFIVKKRGVGCSLLMASIETGRTHQIRVHAQSTGYAICGDKRYGGPEAKRYPRMMLHAYSLRFKWAGVEQCFSTPLPDSFSELTLDR
ncbi:RluA family pseudouridine synthase [Candidatus Comchoanobacter bicostacola]|uniref:Pseudouridine synthase n=1 Tax=Candidatus Comchoanobacter bicostacola TaxID=2919598 RepID=A0ABY5DKE8_9GAMM|nr:RluA family pseudouridine synthase [Candidatus Comchoanobacter bicostacola]UTC24963.1 RluA family pseudouridine synthase [Candidatus Comchoanobacter bicostacola]